MGGKQCLSPRRDPSEGLIAEAKGEATGLIDETVTLGNLLTIRGYGLKIEGDEANSTDTGLYFEPEGDGQPIKAVIIAVNEPRTLKVVVPQYLSSGTKYRLKLITQSSAKHGSGLLKNPRMIHSDFSLTAQEGPLA
jgi:hypothetical protein